MLHSTSFAPQSVQRAPTTPNGHAAQKTPATGYCRSDEDSCVAVDHLVAPALWRARVTHQEVKPSMNRLYPDDADRLVCRRPSESEAICWASAEPQIYFAQARVNLSTLEYADATGDTWVHRATESKNVAVVAELLNRVDDRLIDAPNGRGKTPLHCAACRDAIHVAMLLLSRGADVTRQDNDGNTALALACISGASQNLVELLLSHPNTDVNARNHASNTPLMSVIQGHHNHLIDSLMVAPYLDRQTRNAQGQTLAQVALEADNIVALTLFADSVKGPITR